MADGKRRRPIFMSEQLENSKPKMHSAIHVESRYLDSTKKGSFQTDSSTSKSLLGAPRQFHSTKVAPRSSHHVANSTLNINKPAASSTLSVRVTKPGKVSKVSTPTKDVSLFATDLSVISVGTECGTWKEVEPGVVRLKEHLDEDLAEDLEMGLLLEHSTELHLETLRLLVKDQQDKCAKVMDMQLAALRKAVEDSEFIISTQDVKILAARSLASLREDLATCKDAIDEVTGDLAFTDSKSFKDVTFEVENLLNQLPCRNVKIPKSQEDFDEIQRAATNLSSVLSKVTLEHGEEIERVSSVTKDMAHINELCDTLEKATAGMEDVMPVATENVLCDVSNALMNSAAGKMDIIF